VATRDVLDVSVSPLDSGYLKNRCSSRVRGRREDIL